MLDVPYFHVVFTVPQEIEVIAFQSQTVIYDILFRPASETLGVIAPDPKHLAAEIGFLGVLQSASIRRFSDLMADRPTLRQPWRRQRDGVRHGDFGPPDVAMAGGAKA